MFRNDYRREKDPPITVLFIAEQAEPDIVWWTVWSNAPLLQVSHLPQLKVPLFLPVFAGAVVDNPRPKVLFSSRVCLWGLKGLLMLDCNNWPVNKQKKIFSLNSGRRNLFLKVWMPKAVGLVIGRYLPCFSLPTCDYFTQLRRLFHFFNQSAVEIQYEMSRACMLFRRNTSRRLVVRSACFTVFLLWNTSRH